MLKITFQIMLYNNYLLFLCNFQYINAVFQKQIIFLIIHSVFYIKSALFKGENNKIIRTKILNVYLF